MHVPQEGEVLDEKLSVAPAAKDDGPLLSPRVPRRIRNRPPALHLADSAAVPGVRVAHHMRPDAATDKARMQAPLSLPPRPQRMFTAQQLAMLAIVAVLLGIVAKASFRYFLYRRRELSTSAEQ